MAMNFPKYSGGFVAVDLGAMEREHERQRHEISLIDQQVLYLDGSQVVVTPQGFETLEVVPLNRLCPRRVYDGRVWKIRTDYWWLMGEAVEVESDRHDSEAFQIITRRLRVVHS